MDIISILIIAIALAMDAFAVSIANGVEIRKKYLLQGLILAFSFGLFQTLMPIIGWKTGISIIHIIKAFDHWIAFIILGFIGGKMIYEAKFLEDDSDSNSIKIVGIKKLLALSIATSIDALVVGFSLAVLEVNIIFVSVIIGIVTFCLSFIGVYFGSKFGHFFEGKLEITSGIILILLGCKILIEHLFFGG